jgi:hypothetical protein
VPIVLRTTAGVLARDQHTRVSIVQHRVDMLFVPIAPGLLPEC